MTNNKGTGFAVILSIIALAVAVVVGVRSAAPGSVGSLANTPIYFEQGGATLVVGSGGTIDVQSGGAVEYSSANAYPLVSPVSGGRIACGTTPTFTETTTITPSGLTTVTQVIATQVTVPASTAALLYATASGTSTLTLKSIEADYTVGTTGIVAYYCAVGQ